MELLEPAVSEPKHSVWFGTRLAPYQIIPYNSMNVCVPSQITG